MAIHQWSETAVEETAVEETLRQGACARGFAPEICDDQTRCEICGRGSCFCWGFDPKGQQPRVNEPKCEEGVRAAVTRNKAAVTRNNEHAAHLG